MAIDIDHDYLIWLADLHRLGGLPMSLRPGKRVNAPVIFRWAFVGVGGIRLETIRVGKMVCTSLQAVVEFFARRRTLDASPLYRFRVPRWLDEWGSNRAWQCVEAGSCCIYEQLRRPCPTRPEILYPLKANVAASAAPEVTVATPVASPEKESPMTNPDPVPQQPADPSVYQRPIREYRPRPKTKRKSAEAREEARKDAQRRARRRDTRRIPVPEQLTEPHPLVIDTQTSLAKAVADELGLVEPTAKRCLDLRVTRGLVDRAMRILDTVIKTVEGKGWVFRVDARADDRNVVKIGDEQFKIFLHELVETVPHKPTKEELVAQKTDFLFRMPQRDHVATGHLHLGVTPCYDGRGHWSDTTRWAVEDCLDLLVDALEKSAAAAPEVRRQQAEDLRQREEAQRQREEEQRRQEEERRQKEEERQIESRRIKLLRRDVEMMRRLDDVEKYLRRLSTTAQERGISTAPGTPLGDWLDWVGSYCRRLDPCVPEVADHRLADAQDYGALWQVERQDSHLNGDANGVT